MTSGAQADFDPGSGRSSPGRRLFFLFGFLLAVSLALLSARFELPGPLEFKILAGFFLFFLAPGLLLKLLVLPGRKLLLFEWLPISIALSMAAWSAPGLVAYSRGWSLDTVFALELSIIGLLFLAALFLFRRRGFGPAGADDFVSRGVSVFALLVGSALVALAAWTGAFRDFGLDWDYFNYISAIKKLMAWDSASLAHFAYREAPPDPIHSYNIWALQWALIGKLYGIDPVELYLRSAFLTVPAAAFGFFAMCRRLIGGRAAVVSLFLFASYHVIYGGLTFLGGANFFPADSQWLIVFPACIWLLAVVVEESGERGAPRPGLVFLVAFSALGLSVVHVLWGLCFYLCLMLALFGLWLKRVRAGRALVRAASSGGRGPLALALLLAAVPFIAAIVSGLVMLRTGRTDGRVPLLFVENIPLPAWLDFSAWVHFAAWVMAPAAILFYLIFRHQPRPGMKDLAGPERTWFYALALTLVACLAVASPYIFLRYQAIQSTNWGLFGINPYRAFITPELFFLNPFRRSLQDPNMTFYPFYFLSYLALPWLWAYSRRNHRAWLALAVMIAVPVICFHPALATLFAKFFSLGYLRRLLRLMAIFSMIPLALALDWLVFKIAGSRREALGLAMALAAAVGLSVAAIRFPADPAEFDHRFERMISVARSYPKNTLLFDEGPFLAIREGGWFEPGEVIFSDIWTSYRLTAYLPLFVAAQAKPGVGVPDQEERRWLEREFFDLPSGPERPKRAERRREILDRFGAAGVIVYRDPGYQIYGYACGHPEIVVRLKQDPAHFELLHEFHDPDGPGGWAVFRYRGAEESRSKE